MNEVANGTKTNANIDRIRSIYETASKRVLEILIPLDPISFSTADHAHALREVTETVDMLNFSIKTWAPGAIKSTYQDKAAVMRTRLELMGAKQKPFRKYDPSQHNKKIETLTRVILADYFKANRTIEKTARQYLAILAQAAAGLNKIEQIQEFDAAEVASWIKRIVAGSLRATTKYNEGTAHLTSKDIAAKIRAKLTEEVGGGAFININGRSYNIRDYSELVARTRMREAQTEATIDLCEEYENDLVQVDRHANPCELCAEYQGQVYSISGKHPHYPELPDGGPPWHPNCECSVSPTSETALRLRGRL